MLGRRHMKDFGDGFISLPTGCLHYLGILVMNYAHSRVSTVLTLARVEEGITIHDRKHLSHEGTT
eukprot:2432510-Amphidinium_carterae.2